MKRLLLVLLVLLVSTSVFAQTLPYRTEAKYVCGRPGAEENEAFAFAPGVYYTSINVTNPNEFTIDGRKRFSIAHLNQKFGPWTQWVGWALPPGASMQVDCGDIYAHLGVPPGTFIDGFVQFQSPWRFAATAVYTVTDGSRIVSQDVEAKRVRQQ